MHLLLRETRALDDDASAEDLGHDPADLLFLSFSDSDLGAVAEAWTRMDNPPTLRLAPLSRLKHPLSIDLYVENVVAHARCVVLRVLGGLDYWRYGAEEVAAACRAHNIPLAVLPGDARDDPRLASLSTIALPVCDRLKGLMREGGPDNAARIVRLMTHLAGLTPDMPEDAIPLPACGLYDLPRPAMPSARAAILFYRSHMMAADIAPIIALAHALAERGIAARGIFLSSLKDADVSARVGTYLADIAPDIVLNATGFSASIPHVDAPLLQVVMAGCSQADWQASTRGLSPADLAMQVVLPELDGKLLTTAISFKEAAPIHPALQFQRMVHRPYAEGIEMAANRAAGWAALRRETSPRIGFVLSDYPGGGEIGHAVGLDSFASLHAILEILGIDPAQAEALPDLQTRLCHGAPAPILPVSEYELLFDQHWPAEARESVLRAWGPATEDPAVRHGAFHIRHARLGNTVVAVQPDRGSAEDRRGQYHDPDLPPRHAYIAFYLWLRHRLDIQALLHLGTHGTLEWLPGKAAALSAHCMPSLLTGDLPVIYPFIVNNPGEAAAAKRRLGAVTIGHLTPPMQSAGSHGAAAELEKLIDEYAAADGMDRRRTALLRQDILARAEAAGLLVESGADALAEDDDRLARLDAYLCDVKDMQIRDGLHVFGCPPTGRDALLAALSLACPDEPDLAARLDACAQAERDALRAAIHGRFVAPGPAGAPTRGRADVLPTGRNMFTTDPRAIPTRSALVLAEKAEIALLRRHRQETGEWPRRLVMDLWGSATMRTGGEDLALALRLLGVLPVWDSGSNRVSGFEIVPLAVLDRPRVDVALRISGLFRDAFEMQIGLFDAAVRAVAALDEAPEWNPLAASCLGLQGLALRRATTRVHGAAPGQYGTSIETYAGAVAAYGKGLDGTPDADGFAAILAGADAFLHVQDHRESDLLDGPDWAAHEAGFAVAAAALGNQPALYHADLSQPDAPRMLKLEEEIARVVRGRAANPRWIAGMMRHGYQGAAEIARPLSALIQFATALPQRFDTQFDLLFGATLGDSAVAAFLARENPESHAALIRQFRAARDGGLWRCRSNQAAVWLETP